MSLMNVTLDLNDSFIFKESPEKNHEMKVEGKTKKMTAFSSVETTEAAC